MDPRSHDRRPRRFRSLIRDLSGRTERDVIDELAAQVRSAAAGAELALDVARGELSSADARAAMNAVEHDGDDHRRNVVTYLTRSLTTPIDREDLFRVSRSIDDVLDNLRDFAREYDLYTWRPDEILVEVLIGVQSGIDALRAAVTALGKGGAEARFAALDVRKNDIRVRYQTAMSRILDEPIEPGLLKRRELLRRLDVVGLRLQEAADALADGAIKRSH